METQNNKKRTFYPVIPMKQRKKIRIQIETGTWLRKKQRKTIMDNIIRPLDEIINLESDVKKGMVPIEYYLKKSEMLTKHLMGLFKGDNNET